MASTNQPTRPDRELAASKRHKWADTGEVSRELGGLLSAGQVRDMALRGEIKGAIRVRQRVYVPRYVIPSLVTELDHALTPEPKVIYRGTMDRRVS